MVATTTRRETRQKQEVRNALLDGDDFISAQELYAQLRAEGSRIGLATVYRNLNEMVRNEEADSFVATGGEQRFRACSQNHHHHLICTECGRTTEIQPPLEKWVDRTAREHGFTRVRHVVDLFGVCGDCSA
jgi:Fur family ferric uptake transcriptional regulator